MENIPRYIGYLATLPFFLFLFGTFGLEDSGEARNLTLLQSTYSAIILSFLGGIHWGQAIPRSDNRQLLFSIVPPLVAFGMIIWSMMFDPVMPLFILAALYWLVFEADKKLMPADYIPVGYFHYRRNITLIVCATLVLSALITLL